jgi:hypothetical protein
MAHRSPVNAPGLSFAFSLCSGGVVLLEGERANSLRRAHKQSYGPPDRSLPHSGQVGVGESKVQVGSHSGTVRDIRSSRECPSNWMAGTPDSPLSRVASGAGQCISATVGMLVQGRRCGFQAAMCREQCLGFLVSGTSKQDFRGKQTALPRKRFVLCEIPLLRRVLIFFYSSQSAWVGHQNELLRAEHEQDGGNHPRSIASIRRANTAEPSNIPGFDAPELHPTSIGKLCPSETSASKVHLVCSWRAILGDEVIRGEHYLRAFSIRPMTTVKGCPVHATANYPSALCHDFSEGPAVVSVVVTLRNQLLDAPVSMSLVTKVNPSCELIGLDQSHISLEPDETMEVSFDALIPWGGMHNLQSLQIRVRQSSNADGKGDEEAILYDLSQQWLLNVSDSGNSGTFEH